MIFRLKDIFFKLTCSVKSSVRMTHSSSVTASLPGAGAALFHGDGGAERSEV